MTTGAASCDIRTPDVPADTTEEEDIAAAVLLDLAGMDDEAVDARADKEDAEAEDDLTSLEDSEEETANEV